MRLIIHRFNNAICTYYNQIILNDAEYIFFTHRKVNRCYNTIICNHNIAESFKGILPFLLCQFRNPFSFSFRVVGRTRNKHTLPTSGVQIKIIIRSIWIVHFILNFLFHYWILQIFQHTRQSMCKILRRCTYRQMCHRRCIRILIAGNFNSFINRIMNHF